MLGLLKQIWRKQPQHDIEPGVTSIFSLRKKLILFTTLVFLRKSPFGGDK